MDTKYKDISTVSELSTDEFDNNYYKPSIPVIIKGGANDYKAFKKWSAEYFNSLFGKKKVDVRTSQSGVYDYHKGSVSRVFLPFDEAVDYIKTNKAYYLQQSSIPDNFPELLGDLDEPKWMKETDKNKVRNLWIGGAGCVSPLHFDGSDNFLIQIKGKKEIILFHPDDDKYLYPNVHGPKTLRQISLIDLDNVDHKKFPLYEKSQAYKATIYPGDILYIPLHWWHHVRSMDFSININYWWNRKNLRYYKYYTKAAVSTHTKRLTKKY
ncbi:MAG TPA: cupin-like domain-containing protein [Ignavibacteria bacterium]|mgnify:CR=1 FL=1|nr:cupin-like domain-containing protein [Ignavibacteria bacterium]HMR39301.1 cupin-like domain-containing protein [Ignavibacteria bacterium]